MYLTLRFIFPLPEQKLLYKEGRGVVYGFSQMPIEIILNSKLAPGALRLFLVLSRLIRFPERPAQFDYDQFARHAQPFYEDIPTEEEYDQHLTYLLTKKMLRRKDGNYVLPSIGSGMHSKYICVDTYLLIWMRRLSDDALKMYLYLTTRTKSSLYNGLDTKVDLNIRRDCWPLPDSKQNFKAIHELVSAGFLEVREDPYHPQAELSFRCYVLKAIDLNWETNGYSALESDDIQITTHMDEEKSTPNIILKDSAGRTRTISALEIIYDFIRTQCKDYKPFDVPKNNFYKELQDEDYNDFDEPEDKADQVSKGFY